MKEAAEYLENYVRKVKSSLPGVDERAGHAIASMLAGYRNEIYSGAVKSADKALSLIEKDNYPPVLSKAVTIIKNSSIRLAPMQKGMSSSYTWEGKAFGGVGKIEDDEIIECEFSPEDEEYLAIVLPEEEVRVKKEYDLDNALALCYAIAMKSSPLDEQSLQEWVRGFVLAKISDYIEE
ncbi:MAG: hypothetical protein JW931_06160 [Methanomicrobiaceae archaeon]|nr:hypothetical protein [Methanomicrobiaceae archaeon]